MVLVGGSSRALPVRDAVRKALVTEGFSAFAPVPLTSSSSSSSSSASEGEDIQASTKISNSDSNSSSVSNNDSCADTNASTGSSSMKSAGLLRSNKSIQSGISFELKSSGSSNAVRNFIILITLLLK